MAATARPEDKAPSLPRPLPRQLAWQDAEVGALFRFDMPLFGLPRWNARDTIHMTFDPNLYTPTKLDTDQGLRVANDPGARGRGADGGPCCAALGPGGGFWPCGLCAVGVFSLD